MKERLAAWRRRRNTCDILAVLFIVACLILILVNISMYPVFLDIPYHMAVTRGFQEAGGVTTWDFWDYAPAGRPHIYPPLLHVIMSLLVDTGMPMEFTATLVCLAMFPLILLSLWWAMRKVFGPRAALYAVVLAGVPYAFFWQTGVTIAASLVLALTPLVFLALEKDRKAAAAVLLALCLYSHLVLGHLVALALFIYMLHRREAWRKILGVLVVAYVLYLPWGINVLSNLSSFSASEPGAGGGFALHLLLWGLAAAGFVVCYLRKKQYYLLPAYFLSMIPIVFFYSNRFWEGHAFLPLAMLGGVALDRLHAFLNERTSHRESAAVYARVLAAGALAALLLLVLCVDPVLASSSRPRSLDGPQGQAGVDRLPGGGEGPRPLEGDLDLTFPPPSQGEGSPPAPYGSPYPFAQGEGSPPPTSRDGRLGLPPRGGVNSDARPLLRGLKGLNNGSINIAVQPTTLLVLLGLEEPQRRWGGEQQVFSEENEALMEAVEGYSEPGDVVFTTDGRLGDLIYAMTGRYSMQGMFHEVQPEEKSDPLTEADLVVIPATPTLRTGGTLEGRYDQALEKQGWREAARVGRYAVLVPGDAGGAGGERSAAAVPLWVAYALLIIALGVIFIDLGGRRPRPFSHDRSTRQPHLYQPPDNDGGRGGTVLAVVPARNEEGNVGRVVRDIRGTCPGVDVLVIDDGSTDGTTIEALKAGAMVLCVGENGGVGEAVRLGLAYAFDRGYGYAVRLDGDGQHPAAYIRRLLRPLEDEEAEVVVGSRFLGGLGDAGGEGDVSGPRRLGMAYFRAVLRWSTSREFTDPTSGFRAYSRRAMWFEALKDQPRYPEVTSLRLLVHNHFAVREVAVDMAPRRNGRSTLAGWKGLAMVAGVTLEFLRPPVQTPLPAPA
jgi:hypothetical protein